LADQETLNKADAAAYIGVSVRTLMRLTGAAGGVAHLPKRRESAPTMYAKTELDRYLSSVTGMPIVSGIPVTPDTPDGDKAAVNAGVSRMPSVTDARSHLDTPDERLLMMAAAMAQEMMRHIPALLAPAPNGDAAPASVAVPVADKLTLSLVEAAQLSGLSRGHLREAIEAKKLKARIIGRGWRVKRDDLDLYVRKL
jgi:excisionase family DNA binding protein